MRVIQKYARVYLFRRETKAQISQKNEKILQDFHRLTENFKKDWRDIRGKRRVEIHINSFSFDELKRLSMNKHIQRENIQITRIFQVKDPLLTIIYVCPFPITEDITQYYFKILELGDVQQYKDRLYFLRPENSETFPSHFSLSKKLLYSPRAIKRIRQLIRGKTAYIVPGYPSSDDVKLSHLLQVPLMGGDPQNQFVCSTKSASKRLLLKLGIPTPLSALEIYDEVEFINTLTVLVANNKDVQTWLFKIDDEFSGRGVAYLNIQSIPQLHEILRIYENFDQNQIHQIKNILQNALRYKISIVQPTLYRDYREFITHFIKRGGIIEAVRPNVKKSHTW